MLASGSRAWGGSRNGNLIGVALASPKGTGWWDITFASVLAAHRGTGNGPAIVAGMIPALRADGVARITPGVPPATAPAVAQRSPSEQSSNPNGARTAHRPGRPTPQVWTVIDGVGWAR